MRKLGAFQMHRLVLAMKRHWTLIVGAIVLAGAFFIIGYFVGRPSSDWSRDKDAIKRAFGKAAVDSYRGPPLTTGVELHKPTTYIEPSFLTEGLNIRWAVGRLLQDGHTKACGTAFLIAPTWVMTADHAWLCLPRSAAAYVEFETADGATVRYTIDRTKMAIPGRTCDYVVVPVTPPPNAEKNGIKPVLLASRATITPPKPGDPMNIFQYPWGTQKTLVIQKNDFVAYSEDQRYIFYRADTDEGSSGSPVFNNQWQLVGVHRGDGGTINCGIWIHKIIEDLKQKAPADVLKDLGLP